MAEGEAGCHCTLRLNYLVMNAFRWGIRLVEKKMEIGSKNNLMMTFKV